MAKTSNDSKYSDEQAWESISPASDLRAAPGADELAPPLTSPGPESLNTHELPWETFERLVLWMAKEIDDAKDARIFGRRGQKQYGIDIVGFFLDGQPSVYQAKRRDTFTAHDLRIAVEKYVLGGRPFNASRLIIATSLRVDDTRVLTELDALRSRYKDIEIDIWDRQSISDDLFDKPNIVERFFGAETRKLFCKNVDQSSSLSGLSDHLSVSSDAVVRGPIAYLGLEGSLRMTKSQLESNPSESAILFGEISEKLESSPFFSYSMSFRESQADALKKAHRIEEMVSIRLSVGWSYLRSSNSFFARRQANKIDDEKVLSDSTKRSAVALSYATSFGYEHRVTVQHLAEVFDELEDDDKYAHDFALMFAEQAITWRKYDLVADRRGRLLQISDKLAEQEATLTYAARLKMCIADATGEWNALASTARTVYPPRTLSWIYARHARFLTLTAAPEQASDRWTDATERANHGEDI